MARVLHGIEKGIRLHGVNSDTVAVEILFGSTAPGGDTGEQDDAPIGSVYMRTTGGLYKKIADDNATTDWEEVGNVAMDELVWRSEKVVAGTNDTLTAGSGINPVSWTDNESGVDATNWVVGNHVLGDLNGVPALFRISAIASATSITLVAASIPIADNNTFVVQAYLPDTPGDQEQAAIVHIPVAGSPAIKIADLNWNFADGINMAASYAQQNGTVSAADTVNSAIQKLDGNQIDLTTLSGVAQGAVDLGTFTGVTILDNRNVKQALQDLETAQEEIDQNVNDLIALSGVAENSTDLGVFTGSVIPDGSDIKEALQFLETAVESGITYSQNGVTGTTVIDSALVDSVCAVKWYVYVRESANPSRVKAFEVWATHNGTVGTDATQVDDTTYAKLKIGSNFDLTLAVSLNGTGAAQTIRLTAASTSAGVDVRATREAVSF
jgi:hypothetical protein